MTWRGEGGLVLVLVRTVAVSSFGDAWVGRVGLGWRWEPAGAGGEQGRRRSGQPWMNNCIHRTVLTIHSIVYTLHTVHCTILSCVANQYRDITCYLLHDKGLVPVKEAVVVVVVVVVVFIIIIPFRTRPCVVY